MKRDKMVVFDDREAERMADYSDALEPSKKQPRPRPAALPASSRRRATSPRR